VPILVHIPSYHGREAFILDCDAKVLAWLSDNFDKIAGSRPGQHAGFVLDEAAVSSPQRVRIRMTLAGDHGQSRILRERDQLSWWVSREDAKTFGELVRGLQSCEAPAHQYLETDDPDTPVLVLSKGEYDATVLMSMSQN
jgi:hypothetical protein